MLKVFLENVIRDAVTYTEHARRKTVSAMDVVYALQRQGRTLYGFSGPHGPQPVPAKKKRSPPRVDTSFSPAAPFVGSGNRQVVEVPLRTGAVNIALTYEDARKMEQDAAHRVAPDILDFSQRDPCQIANDLMKIYAGYLVRNHAVLHAPVAATGLQPARAATDADVRDRFYGRLGTAIFNNNVRTPSDARVEFSTLMTLRNSYGPIGPPQRIHVDFRVENETYVIGRFIGNGAFGIVHYLLTPFAGLSYADNINSSVDVPQNRTMSNAQRLIRGMWIQDVTFNAFPYKTITATVHGVARPNEQVEVKLDGAADFASVTPGSSQPWRFLGRSGATLVRIGRGTAELTIPAYNMRKTRTLTYTEEHQVQGSPRPAIDVRYEVQSTGIRLHPGIIDLVELNLRRADGGAGNIPNFRMLRLLDTTTPRVLKNFLDYVVSNREERRSKCAEMYVEALVQSTLFCALRGVDSRIQNKTPFSVPTKEKVARPEFLTTLTPRGEREKNLIRTGPHPRRYYLYDGPSFAMEGAGQMVHRLLSEDHSHSSVVREREFKFFFWRALKLLYRLQSRMRFVHGDLHAGNILYDGRSFENEPRATLTLIDCGFTYCRLPKVAADGSLRTNAPEYTGTVMRVSSSSVPQFVPSFDPLKILLSEWYSTQGVGNNYANTKCRDFMNSLPLVTRNEMAMHIYNDPANYPVHVQEWAATPHGRDLTVDEMQAIAQEGWYNSILLPHISPTQQNLDPGHHFTCAGMLNELTRELHPAASYREVSAIPL